MKRVISKPLFTEAEQRQRELDQQRYEEQLEGARLSAEFGSPLHRNNLKSRLRAERDEIEPELFSHRIRGEQTEMF